MINIITAINTSYTKLVNNYTEHFLGQIAFRLRESVIRRKGVFKLQEQFAFQKENIHSYMYDLQ